MRAKTKRAHKVKGKQKKMDATMAQQHKTGHGKVGQQFGPLVAILRGK